MDGTIYHKSKGTSLNNKVIGSILFINNCLNYKEII